MRWELPVSSELATVVTEPIAIQGEGTSRLFLNEKSIT